MAATLVSPLTARLHYLGVTCEPDEFARQDQDISLLIKAKNERFPRDITTMPHAIMYATWLWLNIGALIWTSAPRGTKYVAAIAV